MLNWLQEDEKHIHSLSSNVYFQSAPSLLSKEVQKTGGEEEKPEVERKARLLSLYSSLLREKLTLPFVGEVLNEAEKILKIIERRTESGNREVDKAWNDLENAGVVFCYNAGKAGIEKKE